MIVLKGEMFKGLCRLVGNVQMGGATRGATISDSSRRHIARRKQVTFACSVEGGIDFGGLS